MQCVNAIYLVQDRDMEQRTICVRFQKSIIETDIIYDTITSIR